MTTTNQVQTFSPRMELLHEVIPILLGFLLFVGIVFAIGLAVTSFTHNPNVYDQELLGITPPSIDLNYPQMIKSLFNSGSY